MSRSIDIFFNSNIGLEEIALLFKNRMGVPFEIAGIDPRTFRVTSMGISFAMNDDHGMENDNDLDFERYKYNISISLAVTSNNSDINESFTTSISKYIYLFVKNNISRDAIIVDNLQKLITV